MSYAEKLTAEIHAVLDSLCDQPWGATWIAHTICDRHRDGLAANDEAMFWRYCGYAEVRDEVRRCINRRAGDRDEPDPTQPRLPGYEHLQSHYVVSRDNIEVGVPVHALTDDEIRAKAALHRAMGAAHFGHADELDRFLAKRTPSVLPLFETASA